MSTVITFSVALPMLALWMAAKRGRSPRRHGGHVPTPQQRLFAYLSARGDPEHDPELAERQLRGYQIIRRLLCTYPEYRGRAAKAAYRPAPRRPAPSPRHRRRKAAHG